MKHIYTLSVAFFFFSLPFLSAQSDKTVELSYTDEVGTVHTFPLTYYGKLGGRNAYTDATDMTGVLWRNKIKRWEILDHEGELAFFSTLNSISNPPELVTGNWQTVITGYTLDVFRGSGTYVALSSEMSNKVDISCNGQMDGGIMVAASQGRPPYKFT
ncbi:MAG: hypothetical protein WA952_17685, partial [Lewinella sp.]